MPEDKPKEEKDEPLPTAVENFDESAYLSGQLSLLGGSTERPQVQSSKLYSFNCHFSKCHIVRESIYKCDKISRYKHGFFYKSMLNNETRHDMGIQNIV